jgi:histidyl-tRNA synthetase
VFGVPLGAEAHADVLTLMTSLRRRGVNADMAFGARGLKGALRAADRSGAAFAVLIGAEERRAGTVSIKDLKTGDQQDVAATQATDWLIERLGTQ